MDLILLLLFQITVATAIIVNYDRKDFVYNDQTSKFYKLHVGQYNFTQATDICSMYCSTLLPIYEKKDKDQGLAMLEKFPDIDYIWVEGNSTFENPNEVEHYESDIKKQAMDRYGKTIEFPANYDKFSFICTRYARHCFNEACKVVQDFRHYSYKTGSCYLVSNRGLIWDEANAECQKMGGHLVVINSETENKVVTYVMSWSPAPQDRHDWAVKRDVYLAGFRSSENSREYLTIFNQTLEEAGFSKWNEGETDGYDAMEYCGALHMRGNLNAVLCNEPFPFICERVGKAMFYETDGAASSHRTIVTIVLFYYIVCFSGLFTLN